MSWRVLQIVYQKSIVDVSSSLNYFSLQSHVEKVFYVPLLTGQSFSHRNAKYTIFVINILCKYLKVMVLTINWILSFMVIIFCSISVMCYMVAKLLETTFSISSYLFCRIAYT